MKLSKTKFASYITCSKSFWLRHRRPEMIRWAPPSAMQRTQMLEGQNVERASHPYLEATFGSGLAWQTTFETDTLIARADFVRTNSDGSIDIFEVKASTKLKDSDGKDHIVDAAFQWLTASRAGKKVSSIHIVHLDGEYARAGEIDTMRLFKSVDVTDLVLERLKELEAEIDAAAAMLAEDEIDLNGCDCQFRGANSRCEAFAYLNPKVVADSAHYLPGIRKNRLQNWGPAFDLRDIATDELTERHKLVQRALVTGRPVVDLAALEAFLGGVSYPIYFYDYETTGPAIPPAEGYRPYQAIPVQFSVHRLEEDGSLHHAEWLSDAHGQESELVNQLNAAIGPAGSTMAWHKSFELGCNTRLAHLHPAKAEFLSGLSERTIDLEIPFQKDYIDWGFRGSSSIKKVLPVMSPELQYRDDEVHDGTGAVEAWTQMIGLEAGCERSELRRQLLEYCKLDTLAMVRIFNVIQKLVTAGRPGPRMTELSG